MLDCSGSSKYPYGTCDNTVTWNDRGIACDACGIWYHAKCQSMTSGSYEELNKSVNCDKSWRCAICGNCHYSEVTFDLHGLSLSIVSDRMDSSLSGCDELTKTDSADVTSPLFPITNFLPSHASTPTRASRQNKLRNRPLRCINHNFRSARGKKPEIINMLDSYKPDVLIGTESHLDKDMADTEFLPPGYKAHRRDRNSDGGVVFIVLTDELFAVSTRVCELETDCQVLWVNLK